MNPAAIEGHLTLVLIQWMIIIAATWGISRLGRKIGQPLAVGEIAAGILLGPSALGLVWPSISQSLSMFLTSISNDFLHFNAVILLPQQLFPRETQTSMQLLGKLGVVFLLFQVGMEFDYSHLRSRSRTVSVVSLMGIAVPVLCGLALGPWIHAHFAPETPYFGFELFFCVALSISALPVMGRILLEMNLERTALGATAISTAAIDDVIGWVMLGVATMVATSHFSGTYLVAQIVLTLVFFVMLQKVIGPWYRRIWRRNGCDQSGKGMPDSFLAILLIGLFLCSLATHYLGIFVLFGAFLFGTSLHQEPTLVKAWRDRFSSIVMVAFVPIFFANTGLNTRIGALQTWETWLACGLVLLAAVIGKIGGCFAGAYATGQNVRESASIAALMNTRGLMGLIAINVGLELKLLTPELFTILVIMALVTTAMCGPLLRWWLPAELRKLVPGLKERETAPPATVMPAES